MLGHDPTRRTISLSYGQDLSLEYAAQFRTVMRSPWYAQVFPRSAASIVRDTASEMKTAQNGLRYATSLGSALTGIGGDMIIIDDLMKGENARSPVERALAQDFYGNTLLSRLNDKRNGSIIAIQQWLHEDDLAGYLLGLGEYTYLNLPAIFGETQDYTLSNGRMFRHEPGDLLEPTTEPKSVLDEIRAGLGGPTFQAQYQQNSTPLGSALIVWNRILTYEDAPPRERYQSIVQSWDTAMADSPRADSADSRDGPMWCTTRRREPCNESDPMAGGLAVVLSGGGAKGAFQVGVLDALIRERGVSFETCVGTSTGAIQAAAVAQDDIGQLVNFWSALRGPGDIYRKRAGTLWAILLGKSSIYSVGPLRSLLDEAIDDAKIRATGKCLRIAVVNITTGELRIVAENADGIANWVYASSAMPFFFPPLKSRDAHGNEEQWVDGGVRDVTPLDAALKERPRAVLVIRASAQSTPATPKPYASLVDIGLRSVEIQSNEVSTNDLKNVNLINRLLTARTHQRSELQAAGLDAAQIERVMRPFDDEVSRFRLVPTMVIEPERDLYDTLDFEPTLIAQAIGDGRSYVANNWTELAQFLGVNE